MINKSFYTRDVYEYHINVMITWWAPYSLEHINMLLSEYITLFEEV